MNDHAPALLDLARFLEMVALGSHTLRLVVRREGGGEGVLDIEEGVVRHAALGRTAGRTALDALLERPATSIEARPLPALLDEAELDLPIGRLLDGRERTPEAAEDPGTVPVTPETPRKAEGDDPADAAFAEGIDAMLRHDTRAAREAFLRVLELRPGDPRARHNLARIEAILEHPGGRTTRDD